MSSRYERPSTRVGVRARSPHHSHSPSHGRALAPAYRPSSERRRPHSIRPIQSRPSRVPPSLGHFAQQVPGPAPSGLARPRRPPSSRSALSAPSLAHAPPAPRLRVGPAPHHRDLTRTNPA